MTSRWTCMSMSDPKQTFLARRDYEALVGTELGKSHWIKITQSRIDQFADCTGDHQSIHVDPETARGGPFGGTIAHGFLTLSMIVEMMQGLPRIVGVKTNVNYGLDRVRFISPVKVDSCIRGRFTLSAFKQIETTIVETTFAIVVEIENHDKPALVADWRARRYLCPAFPPET
ncbi:MaoC family dehydratase [Aquicoccus porphyridii]|uniref:MaoC family dehydratase n=1 Tax=Aquicoccus porphyridii TaxID=1852029 RepID=UPI00273CF797|nr:MaoC family dehydratase [Aquicoccus porphyridii]